MPSASAALARANADYERYSSLVRTGDASQQQLDARRARRKRKRSRNTGPRSIK